MTRHVTFCGRCGAMKTDTNHWFAVRQEEGKGTVLPTFQVLSFADSSPDDRHLCGERCLQKDLSRFADYLGREALRIAAQPELTVAR